MVKKLHCTVVPSDYIRACDWSGDSDIKLEIKIDEKTEDIFLAPSDAKKLRKQIKKALIEIECEPATDIPEEKEGPAYNYHIGEVVEVYQDTEGHEFPIGEKVRIVECDEDFKVEYLDGHDFWWVRNDIRPIQNWKPKEGEKVLIVDSTFAPSDTTREWVGDFGIIGWADSSLCKVYNEDKSDYFGYNLSDLRPAE